MKQLATLAALTILLTLTASQLAMAQTVHTIPAANRAPGTYPMTPIVVGVGENSVDIQFNSTDWSTPGGTFTMLCERLPVGMADVPGNWVSPDFSGNWQTGGVGKDGNPNVPHVRIDYLPGDTVRVTFTVAGKTINLGAVITTSAK